MKFKNIFVSLIFIFSFPAFATISASRQPQENFQQARARHMVPTVFDFEPQGKSAWSSADRFDKLDFSRVADVGTIERLNQIFTFVRDSKFIKKRPQPLTERRLSWLYPDDGCYTRAELTSYFTAKEGMPETFKLFGFGDLAAKTPNHPKGIVYWWYHVVPVYRVGQQAYVMDPSIETRRPMTVQEWKKAIEAEAPSDKFAICNPKTVGPEDNCNNPHGRSYESIMRSQVEYLGLEWDRVKSLGRNPEAELGNSPPW